MKKVALALLMAAPMAMATMTIATVAQAKTVTVNICDGEMHGEGPRCRTVTYTVRPASKPVVQSCTVTRGEGAVVPCATHYGPGWLGKLNGFFKKLGLGSPDQEQEAEQYQRAGGGA